MKNNGFILSMALLFCALALLACFGPVKAQGSMNAAMLPIKTGSNINHWWSGDFEPGTCMTELVNVKLIDSKRYTMYDRENLDKIMQEHNLSIAGEVSPETAIKIGELTGVRYLISGAVIEFSEINSGGGSNFSLGFGIGASGSSKGNKKVKVKTLLKVTDTQTGKLVSKAESEKEIPVASGGGSFYIGGTGGGSEGGETAASGLGKGMEEVAKDLVARLESAPVKTSTKKTIKGYIMEVEGDRIYLGLDSPDDAKSIAKGRRFKVTRSKSIKDPKTLQIKSVNRPVGDIEVISVDESAIVCKPATSCEPLLKSDTVLTEVFIDN